MTRKSMHPHRIQFHLDSDLLAQIDRLAKITNMTRAETIRMLLKRGLRTSVADV